jgi:predicted small secreted protein
MKTTRSILMLVVAVATLTACEKTAVGVIDDPAAGHGANVKFFNFSVGSPQVNFFVNDKKVTAISATGCYLLDDTNRQQCLSAGSEATTGVAYGSAGNGTSAWYSDVTAGQATISGKIATTTDKNLAIANLQTTVTAGKFYSYYLSGIYNTTAKTSDAFIVEDVMPPEDFNVAYVRFVNASSTTQPMTLFVTNRTTTAETAVGGPVAYKSGGAFVSVPVGSYDLRTRVAGSTTNVFSRDQISFAAGRAYTITARGNTATASTMLLDNTANR